MANCSSALRAIFILLVLTTFGSIKNSIYASDTDGTHFYWVSDKTGTDDGFLKKYGAESRGNCLHYLARVDGLSLQRGAAVAIGNAQRNNTENWQGFVDFVSINPNIVLGMNSGLMNKSWEFATKSEWTKNWIGDVSLINVAKNAGIQKVVMFLQSPLSKGGTITFNPNAVNETQPNGGANLDMRILDCVEYADFIDANKPDGIEVTYGLIDAHPAKTVQPADAYHKAYVDLVKAFTEKGYVLEEIQIDMKTQTVNTSANKLVSACKRAYTEILQQTGQHVRLSWYTWNGNVDTDLQANNLIRNAFNNIAGHPDRQFMTGLLLDGNNENRSGIIDLIPTDLSEKFTITARLNEAFSVLEKLNVMNPVQKGDPILGSNNTGGEIIIQKPTPDNLSITVKNSNSLLLNWSDNIANEVGFVIERSSENVPEWTKIDTTDANVTSYTDTGLSPFTMYNYRLLAIYEGDTLSAPTNPVPGRPSALEHSVLPAPWKSTSFGSEQVGIASSSWFSEDTFKIDAGDGDFWTENDRGHFIYQTMHGDGSIIARLTDYDHVQAYSMAGVMMRESLDSGSKFASMMMMSDPGPILRERVSTNGSVNQKPVLNSKEKSPYWLKLERNGNNFTGSISENGSTWQTIRTATVSMNPKLYVGMAATSHTTETNGIYAFTNIQLDINTSTNDPDPTSPFIAYHNKLVNKLIINRIDNNDATVKLYDVSGKLLINEYLTGNHIEIPTNGFKKGIYIIELSTGLSRQIKKVNFY